MKVSVIVPVYNAEAYLCECLDSIMNQTLEDIEVICVDDGCTDNSLKILEEYAENDRRFKILRQENMYAGVARNKGLEIAKGKYVIFWDADDIFASNTLELMYSQSEENDLDICVCNVAYLDDATKKINDYACWWHMEKAPCGVFSYKDCEENIFKLFGLAAWNKLFKREFVEDNNIEFQSLKRCNDNYFVAVALVLAEKIKFINEKLIIYRINNDKSLQGERSGDVHAADVCEAFKAIKEKLLGLGIYEDLKCQLLNSYLDDYTDTLLKQNNYENFKLIYEKVKDSLYADFEIEEQGEGYWYWCNKGNYDVCKDIAGLDCEEFLYKYFGTYRHQVLMKCESGQHKLPADALDKCRNLVIYGAGECGKAYFRQIMRNPDWKVVAWIDRNYASIDMGCISIYDPERIRLMNFDKILIAIVDENVKGEVREDLISMGIEEGKIVI